MKKKLVVLLMISFSLVSFMDAQKQVNSKDYSHWSLTLKGGVDFYRVAPVNGTYLNNMSWTFPGLLLEYSINPLFGVGLDMTYLNYVRKTSISGDLGNGSTLDLTAEGSVNLFNLLIPNRGGMCKKSNLYATLGGGIGFYSFDKENGESGSGSSPLGTIGLKFEHNLSDALALGAGVHYRTYSEEVLGKYNANHTFQSDALVGTINLRYKIGAKAKQHVLNTSMADYYPAPKPEVIEKPAAPVEKFDNSANLQKMAAIEDKNVQLEAELQKLKDQLQNLSSGMNADGSFNFDNIQFETNSNKLTAASTVIVDNIAKIMSSSTAKYKLNIAGHTDADGSDAYNQKLSVARANAVKAYLQDKGVATDLMTTTGYGESKPVGTNATAEGKAKNRRVEFSISK
jgi:OOP family OmpA-OmpF porin